MHGPYYRLARFVSGEAGSDRQTLDGEQNLLIRRRTTRASLGAAAVVGAGFALSGAHDLETLAGSSHMLISGIGIAAKFGVATVAGFGVVEMAEENSRLTRLINDTKPNTTASPE